MLRVVCRFVLPMITAAYVFIALLLVCNGNLSQISPRQSLARFTSFEESRLILEQYRESGLPGSALSEESQWNEWIRRQDSEVRSRIDRGVEDSISNFVLYGTSFTGLPRLSGTDETLNSEGAISSGARARVRALVLSLQNARLGERLEFITQFLARKRVLREQWVGFLTANLVRFSLEQQAYQKKLDEAAKSKDASEVMAVRGTLYEKRGLSADTSLLPNFAIEEALRVLTDKGVLKAGCMRRIAIVGPGLDFADKRDGYDFYPLQSIQPFAILESVKRLQLAAPGLVEVMTLDLNVAVNAHLAKVSSRGLKGQPYTIQLPRDTRDPWSDAAIAYWQQFGSLLGTSVKPLPIPDALPSVTSRAIAVRAEYAGSVVPIDLNVVTQTLELPESEGFDLVVATNILVYYDRFQQALSMSNIANMMNPGGIFVANHALPAAHDSRLKYLGRKNVVFAKDGAYGDDVVVYQRQQ